MIRAILACDDTGGVSRDGTLPWPNNPRDLRWFKDNTAGHVVIMGSTTWEDPHMPRPLPKRKNYLVTTRKDNFPGADGYISGELTSSVAKIAEDHPGLITWVIGGPNIIEQTLGVIDEFYLSRIPGDYDCDTHLPLDKIKEKFTMRSAEDHPEVRFEVWEKK